MKTSWLSLINALTMGTLILSTACQEKVAPELSAAGASAGSTTTGGSGGGAAATHNFTLTLGPTPTASVLPSLLNYQLHKVNEVYTSQCKVEDVLDVPDVLDSTRDITCFVEAEEWALYSQGIGLNIASDAETCDYILYKPYSFQQWQAGLTLRRDGTPRVMVQFNCSEEVTTLFGATADTTFGENPDGLTMAQLCGNTFNVVDNGAQTNWGDLDLTLTSATIANNSAAPQAFCSFDYSDELVPEGMETPPNCDPGQITYFVANVTAIDTDADTIPDTLSYSQSSELHNCGGNIRACTSGPMVDLLETQWLQSAENSVFTQTNEAATSVLYSVEAPHQKDYFTNMHIANFTRQCSGISLWNTDASFAASSNSYNPDLIAEYAELGANTSLTQEVDEVTGFDVLILSDDPFRAGLSTLPSNNLFSVNLFGSEPHYQFLCLDKSFDIKARIRLAIREWNRNFNVATTSLAYISDVYKDGLTTAQMDATNIQTVPHGPWVNYNDREDWDDFLRWDDSGGTASCTTSFMDDGDGNATTAPTRSREWFPELSL